jgi:hypothetical protein
LTIDLAHVRQESCYCTSTSIGKGCTPGAANIQLRKTIRNYLQVVHPYDLSRTMTGRVIKPPLGSKTGLGGHTIPPSDARLLLSTNHLVRNRLLSFLSTLRSISDHSGRGMVIDVVLV